MYDHVKKTLLARKESIDRKIVPTISEINELKAKVRQKETSIRDEIREQQEIEQTLAMIEEDIKRNTHESKDD